MKRIFAFFAIFLTFLAVGSKVSAGDDFDVAAEHAIAVEATTGEVLYKRDATTPDGIASMTKILTVYLVCKVINEGRLSWNTKISILDYAYNLATNSDANNVPVGAREYMVEQLVNTTVVTSANSAVIALAEQIGGTESEFVDMTKAQLGEQGITDVTIVNASGLNNNYPSDSIYLGSSSIDENTMSTRDIAIIAQHLITKYPDILKITGQTTADSDDTTMNTYNYMLGGIPYERSGVNGLKTGTTELAGVSFVATSTENGMRIIPVVMNADGWEDDEYAHFEATNNLLGYVKSNYEMVALAKAGKSHQSSKATVNDGRAKSTAAVTSEDLKVVRRVSTDVSADFSTNADGYDAPITKKQKIGTITYNDTQIIGTGYLDSEPGVTAVTKTSVDRSIFFEVRWNHFVTFVSEKL